MKTIIIILVVLMAAGCAGAFKRQPVILQGWAYDKDGNVQEFIVDMGDQRDTFNKKIWMKCKSKRSPQGVVEMEVDYGYSRDTTGMWGGLWDSAMGLFKSALAGRPTG